MYSGDFIQNNSEGLMALSYKMAVIKKQDFYPTRWASYRIFFFFVLALKPGNFYSFTQV